MKINRLNESAANDEFFEIQDIVSAALNSIGGDMDDVTGGITSSYDEDRLLLSLYSTVDRKDARKFKKNFLTTIESALARTRFSEVSQDENHTYAYQLSRNDIFNMLGSDRAEEFMSKFAMFEICITAYGKKLEEAMTIAYSEDTIKSMISQLEKEIEDYKQLIIDEPEDKAYWEEEIKKCEDEISDLESYKPLDEGIDGWDNRTGVIRRIAKYLYNNPDAEPPVGYINRRSPEYEQEASRYGDYVTTPFGNIDTDTLMKYAKDHNLLNESGSICGEDSIEVDNLTEAKIFGAKGKKKLQEAGELLPIEVLNQDGTPKQYDVKFMDLERLPGKLNWDVADQLQDHFRKNNLWVDELHYNKVNDRIEFDINWGDWKHEHLRAKWLLQELFDTLGIKAEIRSHTTEEDGSDNYSAHYVVYSIG